jgi:hypothetical protein
MIGIVFSKTFFNWFGCMADVVFVGGSREQYLEGCIHKKEAAPFETTSLVGAESR